MIVHIAKETTSVENIVCTKHFVYIIFNFCQPKYIGIIISILWIRKPFGSGRLNIYLTNIQRNIMELRFVPGLWLRSPCSFYCLRLPIRITVRDSCEKQNMYISVGKSYLAWIFFFSELVIIKKRSIPVELPLQDWGMSTCHGIHFLPSYDRNEVFKMNVSIFALKQRRN